VNPILLSLRKRGSSIQSPSRSPLKNGTAGNEGKPELLPRFQAGTEAKVKNGMISGVITGSSGRHPQLSWTEGWGNYGVMVVRTDPVDAGRTIRLLVSDRNSNAHQIEVRLYFAILQLLL